MNVLKLQRKFPQLSQEEVFGLVDQFQRIDIEDNGYVDKQTVVKAVSDSGEASYDDVRTAMKSVDVDASGRVELDDFVELMAKLREPKPLKKKPPVPAKAAGLGAGGSSGGDDSAGGHRRTSSRIVVGGSSEGITHTINEEERTEFTRHINSVLAGDADIGGRLPFPTHTFQMFDECRDGLVLSKLINDSVPDTIDTRVLNLPKKGKALNNFQMTENANIVINSAKGIGCVVVNVHAEDIIDGREHLILGLIWQIIRRGLLSKIDIKLHPELYRLLEEDETLEQFLRLPPEQILLRWFNYHLKAANWHRRVNNFSGDVKDGENYTILLNQLASNLCSKAPLQTPDLLQRAEQVLQNADKLECRKYLTPTALVAGNPKLNLAFVAHLFNTHPGLEPITEEEHVEIEDFDAEGEREARVFTLWLNSLEVDPPVISLFEDLKDGTVLLQAYDKVIPGSINQRFVNKRPIHEGEPVEMSRFKAVENTNYAVELGKANKFSLVGIEGADITDGNKTLTLGLVWQLMRRNIALTIQSLSKNGREITDSDMLKWAHEQVRKGGKSATVRSFKDPNIASAVFLLDVLNGLKPGYVDYDLVSNDHYANAKLAISIARKLGALIWIVPEDINEVRSRLILTFVASLMALNIA
ncbi:fimbrin [Trichomonascus vanleenenianus]|uniref:fimbrin n=1 Tax=Trichomonascus vanleenenianus TaxID=2268995 RepID=UPI003ECB3BDD